MIISASGALPLPPLLQALRSNGDVNIRVDTKEDGQRLRIEVKGHDGDDGDRLRIKIRHDEDGERIRIRIRQDDDDDDGLRINTTSTALFVPPAEEQPIKPPAADNPLAGFPRALVANVLDPTAFETIDEDKDGKISGTELATALKDTELTDIVKGLFTRLDSDGDGFITKAEADTARERILEQLAERDPRLRVLDKLLAAEPFEPAPQPDSGLIGHQELIAAIRDRPRSTPSSNPTSPAATKWRTPRRPVRWRSRRGRRKPASSTCCSKPRRKAPNRRTTTRPRRHRSQKRRRPVRRNWPPSHRPPA